MFSLSKNFWVWILLLSAIVFVNLELINILGVQSASVFILAHEFVEVVHFLLIKPLFVADLLSVSELLIILAAVV